MKRSLDELRKLSGGAIPKWSPALARPLRFRPRAVAKSPGVERIVYFPSCAARNMGAQRGNDGTDALPVVAERLFAKAGFHAIYPHELDQLCCGQPFESKGLVDIADVSRASSASALRSRGRAAHRARHESLRHWMKRYLRVTRGRTASNYSR
jgi:D-lactate dehydrogenase